VADGRRSQPDVGENDPTQHGSRGALRRSVSGRMGLPAGDAPPVLSADPLAIGTDAPFEPAPGGAPTAISPSPPPAMEGPAPPNVPIGNAETVQIRTRRESGSASVPGTIGRTANSPVEAMFLEEVARTRVFALMCIAIDVLAVVGLPFLGGNTLVRNLLLGELVVNLLGATYLYFDLRDPGRYRGTVVMSLALLATVTAYTAILYWGINSAAPCMIVLGIYFFSRNQSLAAALVVYGMCAGIQALLAALTLSGAVPDPGMYTGAGLPLVVQIITQVIIQFMFFAAYVLARSGRTSTLRVVDGLLQAHRHAEQREAAFQEVKQDLDRMLQLGGPGRHTDRILGNYKLGVVIGRGAMGEVYEALHMQGGDRAAVKLLHPNVLSHPGSIERFLREAKAAGALESPHVVRVLDASPPGSGLPYLIMEYLTGNDLAHHLRKRRRLPFDKLEQLVRQVGSALDEAAEKGIVHRDIKPQNLFLLERSSGGPIWKVLDFGASKLAQHKGTLTEGRVVGTPAYMAPEQARGEDVTPSADVYALAAISYRCLTGRPPFSGKDLPTTLYNVCYSMPPQPSLVAELPHAVDSVLAVGLAKTAAERFESAGELADALASSLGGHRDDWIDRRAQALLAHMSWGSTP
jgi:serine/threonine-protein kinase